MAMTGTAQTRTEHNTGLAAAGFMTSMLLPALPAIWGLFTLGAGAIDWLGALVWGVIATLAFTLFSMMGKAMGMTRMDLLDLLGSMVARPGSGAAKAIGGVVHLMNGALLGVAFAYAAALFAISSGLWSGVAWGVFLWIMALLMMTTMGAVHPAIRRGEQDDPGPAATHFGSMTPLGSLIGHLVYGAVLGWGYASFPIA